MSGSPERSPAVSPDALLGLLRSRRVVRNYAPGTLDVERLQMIAEAGTWASSASNNRVHRFLVVRDSARMQMVKKMSPGIYSIPAAMIVICTDLRVAERVHCNSLRTPRSGSTSAQRR